MKEERTMVISMPLSQEAYEQIELAASMRGLEIGEYVLDSALHRECRLTPAVLCKLENILQKYSDAIERPKVKKSIRREMDALWEYLK